MAFEFKLPDIGEGVVEGEIVAWLVQAGDVIEEDQPVVEVLTDKATVVIPSPKAGTVQTLPWQAGDTVPVGDTLVVIDAAEGAESSDEPPPPAATASPAPASEPVAEVPTPAPAAAAPAVAPASSKTSGDSGHLTPTPFHAPR